jgi:hypothetical protein
MSDAISRTEQLVQRFVDQELSAEERIQFVMALGRDQTLRERVLVLEQLVLDATRLTKPMVPDDFVSRVMAQTPTAIAHERGHWSWRRAIGAMWTPRTLHWNVASAAAFACVALLAVGAVIVTMRQSVSGPTPAAATAAPHATVLVRLVVVQPRARVVQAAGDFNGWNPTRTPLEQTSDGAWTVTLPLEPGRYEYQFVVDGDRWIGDPFAVEQNDDGFGSHNAVLDVRPPAEASL